MSNTTPVLSNKIEKAIAVIRPIRSLVSVLSQKVSTEEGELSDEQKDNLIRDWLWARLEKLGIYDDEDSHEILMSEDCQEGDARCFFCENGEPNLPITRFKRVWRILKDGGITVVGAENPVVEKSSENSAVLKQLVEIQKSNRHIGQWTDAELLAAYDPEASSIIIDELNQRAKGRRFIIFHNEDEGVIDQEASLRLLKEARKRKTPIHYKMSDITKKTYIAGEFPSQVYFECPIHKGILLFDGYCDECGHTWEAVDYTTRQFVRVVVECGQAPKEVFSLKQLISDARNGVEHLSMDYPKVAIEFSDRMKEDNLPSLKSRTAKAEDRVADPFQPGKRRY